MCLRAFAPAPRSSFGEFVHFGFGTTEEQLLNAQYLFKEYDTNEDGSVDLDEFEFQRAYTPPRAGWFTVARPCPRSRLRRQSAARLR